MGVAYLLLLKMGGPGNHGNLIVFGAKVNSLVRQGEFWRIISSAFLHIDATHLLLNAYSLLILGLLCELVFGHRRFLIIFTLSTLSGGVSSLLFTEGIAAGASGAIFGLFGAAIIFGIKFRRQLPRRVLLIFWLALLPWFSMTLILGFISPARIDNMAHLGGLLGGLLTSFSFRTRLNARPLEPRQRMGLNIGMTLCAVLIILSLTLAVRNVLSGGTLWLNTALASHENKEYGYQLSYPRPWKLKQLKGRSLLLLSDEVGGQFQLVVEPGKTSVQGLLDDMRFAARLLPQGSWEERGLSGLEIDGLPARRLEIRATRKAVRYSALYYILATRGRAFIFKGTSASKRFVLYRQIFDRIARSFKVIDGGAYVQAWENLTSGHYAVAARNFAEASLKPLHSSSAHLALARLYMLSGWIGPGQKHFKAVMKGSSRDASLQTVYGTLYFEAKLYALAIDHLNRALSIEAGNAMAYNNLAWLYATATEPQFNHPHRALAYARKALSLTRWREPMYIDTLAEAYYRLGQHDKAILNIRKAIKLDPGREIYRVHLKRYQKALVK